MEYKRPWRSQPETLCPATLHLPSTMRPALHCACALVLVYLVPLLLLPEGVLGEQLQLSHSPGPRVAEWLTNFGQLNKYMEKLFNSSLKSKDTKKSKDDKNSKKPLNATKAPPPNA